MDCTDEVRLLVADVRREMDVLRRMLRAESDYLDADVERAVWGVVNRVEDRLDRAERMTERLPALAG
jgi:hypothetical protein